MLVAGGLGVLAAALAGWAVAANGLRPVRRLTRSVERIADHRGPRPRWPSRATTRSPGWPAAFNQMLDLAGRLPRPPAAAGRRRRPRAAHPAHLAAHQPRPARPGRRPTASLPEEARRELLDDVRAQIEELTTLVGDLVVLAREDQPAAVIEPVDLADVTERALARVRRRAPGIDFDVRLDHWRVTGDATGLERAVLNLLDNAAKWSPPRRHDHGAARLGRAHHRRPGPGHPGAGPAARLRALLARRRVALDARLGPRAWRSCGRWSTVTAGGWPWPTRRAAAPGSRCGCPASRPPYRRSAGPVSGRGRAAAARPSSASRATRPARRSGR